MKRALSLVLAFAMLLASLLSLSSCTLLYDMTGELKIGYPHDDGFMTVQYAKDKNVTDVKIPATYGSAKVGHIADFAFENCKQLKQVTIPEGIKTIGSDAFSGCNSLASVKIPASVTYVAPRAFYSCDALTKIEVEDGNERYESIDGVLYDKIDKVIVAYPMGLASECYTVKEGTLTIGSNAFAVASKLETVVLTDSVTVIEERAFSACSVKSLYMSGGVVSCGYAPFAESDMTIYFAGSEEEWNSIEHPIDDITVGTIPVFFGVSYTP